MNNLAHERKEEGAAAQPFLSAPWFEAINAHLAGRDLAERINAPLGPFLDHTDIERLLLVGAGCDRRKVTVNVALSDVGDAFAVVFDDGHFMMVKGLLRFADAVVSMDRRECVNALRMGTDVTLQNAVSDGRLRAAGEWDAIYFTMTSLLPEQDAAGRSLTLALPELA